MGMKNIQTLIHRDLGNLRSDLEPEHGSGQRVVSHRCRFMVINIVEELSRLQPERQLVGYEVDFMSKTGQFPPHFGGHDSTSTISRQTRYSDAKFFRHISPLVRLR